jgi:hypothetical protein
MVLYSFSGFFREISQEKVLNIINFTRHFLIDLQINYFVKSKIQAILPNLNELEIKNLKQYRVCHIYSSSFRQKYPRWIWFYLNKIEEISALLFRSQIYQSKILDILWETCTLYMRIGLILEILNKITKPVLVIIK